MSARQRRATKSCKRATNRKQNADNANNADGAVVFAVARAVGWVSQWREMSADGAATKITRPRQLYDGPLERPFVPLSRRGAGGDAQAAGGAARRSGEFGGGDDEEEEELLEVRSSAYVYCLCLCAVCLWGGGARRQLHLSPPNGEKTMPANTANANNNLEFIITIHRTPRCTASPTRAASAPSRCAPVFKNRTTATTKCCRRSCRCRRCCASRCPLTLSVCFCVFLDKGPPICAHPLDSFSSQEDEPNHNIHRLTLFLRPITRHH